MGILLTYWNRHGSADSNGTISTVVQTSDSREQPRIEKKRLKSGIIIAGLAALLGIGGVVSLLLLHYNLGFSIPHQTRLWERVEPPVYFMEVMTWDGARQHYREVIVQDGNVVDASSVAKTNLLEYGDYNWLDSSRLTVEDIFKSAREWCIDDDECLLKFDPDFHYLRFAGTSWRGIRIIEFVPCEQVETCGPN